HERGNIVTSNNNILDLKYIKNGTNMEIKFNNNKKDGTYIELPLIYYSGYNALYNDGKVLHNLKVINGRNSLTRIYLNDYENGSISVSYQGTKLQKIGNLLSCFTLVLLLLIVILRKILRKKHKVGENFERTV